MGLAVELAQRGPQHGPNPQVGCVILGAPDSPVAGVVIGQGWHEGAGTPHAEVMALADAAEQGHDVTGAVAYVTLEPCAHTGRTGPCADALTRAGVGEVRYAVTDPGESSAGGAAMLTARDIPAILMPDAGATELTRRWVAAMRAHRPYVIAKWAATLDGRMAAIDGTSVWITGDEARAHAHHVRGRVDAILVGTGTVLADDPELSARPGGHEVGHQPLRVVMGTRDTSGARVWRDDNALAVPTHDPAAALAALWEREVRTVIVEGGPTVLTAFVAAGLVDEVNAYVAPALLGAGPTVLSDVGISTMAHALRGQHVTVTTLGVDTLVTALAWKEA